MTDLEQAMNMAARKPVLDVQRMDIDPQNPALLAETMGSVFVYSDRVEKEVARDAETIHAFLPHLDPVHARYVDEVWMPQELAHGAAHDALLETIGQKQLPLSLEVDNKIKFFGNVAKLSENLHRIFFMVYATRGAIHERTTAASYNSQVQKLKALGETGLVETMFKPILVQEAPHLRVYKEMAKDTWATMPRWEQRLSRFIFAKTFSPVGTGNPEAQTKPHFGEVALILAGQEIEEFTKPIQDLATELMGADSDIVPKSILDSMRDCIAQSQAKSAS